MFKKKSGTFYSHIGNIGIESPHSKNSLSFQMLVLLQRVSGGLWARLCLGKPEPRILNEMSCQINKSFNINVL
jgi:hypothetical protein